MPGYPDFNSGYNAPGELEYENWKREQDAKRLQEQAEAKLWEALSHAANRYLDREDAEEFMQFIKDYIK